ncbi:hypothetical protein O181_047889 [Austropuccinia psidii MF-1]|uniref:Uncharacterized protein n=1 Tax=Austropuccinia psidii MF-1 TaxID=1389203 RepID=A0A9Q3DRQ9_9BASI|nr:hypothetical protein [Austropuccinia psidii MF-1]
MSSKLTELTESSPSSPPPSLLCGSGVFSRLSSPSIAPSGHFDPSQIYDGYRAVEILDPTCTEFLAKGKDCFQHYNPQSSKCHYLFIGKKPCCCTGVPSSNVRRYLWSRRDGPFGKELPVSEAPTSDGTSGFSQVIPSTPRTFEPVRASIPTTIPPSSPSTSHARPALNPAVRPSKSQKPRNSPITTSQQLQPVASSSRRRDGLSPFLFPAAQVFQRRDCWPIQITRGDPNVVSEDHEAVARLFRRVDRNSREVIMYATDRTVPGTASEEMAAKFAWYEDELINDFQRTFDDLGTDN